MWVEVLMGLCIMAATGDAPSFLPADDMRFLESITADVVEASRVRPGDKVGDIGPNATGGTLIRPGGRACYPAFWIRDYAMSLDAGCITADEQRHAVLLTAANQQETLWHLRSGSIVPPGSIADHISFGGKPIFFAGCLEDYEGQGGPNWGKLPCLDDHYYFIHMAALYVQTTGDAGILLQPVKGVNLIDRLLQAFAMPPSRPDTGLVYAEPDARGITFGFVDCITHTGDLLFCSLLKYTSALELAGLLQKANQPEKAATMQAEAARIKAALLPAFATPSGWLRASTGISAQPDVWGTAFAVYTGAIEGDAAKAARRVLTEAYRAGTIAWRGMIRHVPTDADFSPSTAWEKALAAKNTYQNGAYWSTPTGWVCYAIFGEDPSAARQLALELITELREGDFRKGAEFGAPWECRHPEKNHQQNPVYMTSVTCPLAAFQRIDREEGAALSAAGK